MKSKGTAYLLWLISGFGWFGFHHFYLGKIGKGIVWILTGGVFGFGSLIDLFTLGGAVESYNTKEELKTIRAASMKAAASSEFKIENTRQGGSKTQKPGQKPAEPKSVIKLELGKIVKQIDGFIFRPFVKFVKSNKKAVLIVLFLGILFKVIASFLAIDYSNPKDVMIAKVMHWYQNDWETQYKYLSPWAQSIFDNKDDFIKRYQVNDTVTAKYEVLNIKAEEVDLPPIKYDGEFEFKAFKITDVWKYHGQIDSTTDIDYVVKDGEGWKFLRWNKLVDAGKEYDDRGDFTLAKSTWEDIINHHPFYAEARIKYVWSEIRTNDKNREWVNECVNHLNAALVLDSTEKARIMSTFGALYTANGEAKRAVKYFESAAEHYKDSINISTAYGNAAVTAKAYSMWMFNHLIEKALRYNPKSSWAWKLKGDLAYEKKNYLEAGEHYGLAISSASELSDNYVKVDLYGKYAICLQKTGKEPDAHEYILKCIELFPRQGHPIFKDLDTQELY